MLSLKEKISILIESQLPEYIGVNNPTFLAFLKYYYEFLEQPGGPQELLGNIVKYRDIDQTTSEFIEYFKKEYCSDIPRTSVVDDSLLIKKIKELYNSKGSQSAYDLLFRILFNKSIDFTYPGTQVLIASDGRWSQDVSLFVETQVGNPDTIVGTTVDIISSVTGVTNTVYIKSKEIVYESSGGATTPSTTTYQYYIDNSNNLNININDIILHDGYRGIVVPTTVSVEVISSGAGFKVGQLYNIVSGSGTGSVLKIQEVNSSGGIVRASFIRFGIGYNTEFISTFSSTTNIISPGAITFGSGTISLVDNISNLVDTGTLNTYDYALTGTDLAFDPSYAGTILRTFTESTGLISSVSGNDATIFVRVGAKTKYPGYFKDNKGFLSDDIFLQDQDYYQPYSYVIKIDEQLDKYKKVVLDLLHPAGTKLFGEYVIKNTLVFDLTEESALLTEVQQISYIGPSYASFISYGVSYVNDAQEFTGYVLGTSYDADYVGFASYNLQTNYTGAGSFNLTSPYISTYSGPTISYSTYLSAPDYTADVKYDGQIYDGLYQGTYDTSYVGFANYTLDSDYVTASTYLNSYLLTSGYELSYVTTSNYNITYENIFTTGLD